MDSDNQGSIDRLMATIEASRSDLELLAVAWLVSAQQAPSNVLPSVDDFRGEQARQLKILERMAMLVRGDDADPDAEHALRRGHVEAVLHRIRAEVARNA